MMLFTKFLIKTCKQNQQKILVLVYFIAFYRTKIYAILVQCLFINVHIIQAKGLFEYWTYSLVNKMFQAFIITLTFQILIRSFTLWEGVRSAWKNHFFLYNTTFPDNDNYIAKSKASIGNTKQTNILLHTFKWCNETI